MDVLEASFRTETDSISLGLIALKSDDEMGIPSRMKRGEVPEFMEFVPLILKLEDALGSPVLDRTVRPAALA